MKIEKSEFIETIEKFISNSTNKKSIEIEFKRAIVVGDLHGDLYSARYIFDKIKKIKNAIFLGDYGDRGKFQIETYYEILKLSESCDIILLRGNHESNDVFPHDLPFYVYSYFQDKEIYELIKKFWEILPINAFSDDYFFVHGGIPTKGKRINEDFKDVKNPEDIEEFLWNDPGEEDENSFNYERFSGFLFGKITTRNFLKEFGVKCIIRSHEPRKVLKVEQDGMVVTIGSCIYSCYSDNASFLDINFDEKIKDGNDVVKKFGKIFS